MKYIVKLTLIFVSLLFVLSCKRKNAEDIIITPPSQLTVEVLLRASTSASVKWTHTGFVNESTTRYRVMLDGITYKDNLTGSALEITGLKAMTEYKGKLIAYNSYGDLATAEFTLDALNGYIIYGGPEFAVSCNWISGSGRAWSYYGGVYSAASPAIAGDTLFIYTKVATISALNLHTGKLIWESGYLPISNEISLLYHKNTLYTATSNGVEAFNSSNGSFKWKYTNNLLWSASNDPVIADNLLIIGNQNHLVAVDLNSHQTAWVYNAKVHTNRSPVVYKDKVIFNDHAGYAYALDAKTGKEVWSKELKRQNPAATGVFPRTPVISGELVIVTASMSGYYALNANTGNVLWSTHHKNGSDVAAGGGMVFYMYKHQDGFYNVVAVNALTGKIIWEQRISSPDSSIDPIYANGKLYIGGKIYNASNGTFLGSMGSGSYWSVVLVDKGIPYYQARSGMAN